jgi:hypothetical protein
MGTCFHTTTVTAPIEEVWTTLANFHDTSWATGVIETCDKVGEFGANEVGAQRILNGVFHETLASIDPASHQLTYTIDDGPGPLIKDAVRRYVGAVKLRPITIGGGTFIEWSSSYESADDSAVGELCNSIYAALLVALRTHFGA